jgi:hypothetical protein
LFLHSTSLLFAGGATGLLGPDGRLLAASPQFSETPNFKPRALFLTWSGNPTTTMTVQWLGEKEEDGTSRALWYRRSGSQMWHEQPHTARRFPKTDLWLFRAQLTGLEPDSQYRFRVGLDSEQLSFRTMPAKATNAIHFVSGGDSGTGSEAQRTNLLAAAQQPQFVLLGGDLAYENGRNADTFLKFIDNYSRDLRDDKGYLVPLLACIGNHEVDSTHGKQREDAPFFYALFDGLYPDTGYATLDFGDYMSLVMLDTGHTSAIAGDQTDWLDKALKAREEVPNLFVFNHVPSYPCVRSYEDKGISADMRKHWNPLFERYNVDAVFEHHDHAFKRTHRMAGGLVNDRGVLYLGDGSWGKLRSPKGPDERPYLAAVASSYHMSVHRIEGADRFHMALSSHGRVVDVCHTRKLARMK